MRICVCKLPCPTNKMSGEQFDKIMDFFEEDWSSGHEIEDTQANEYMIVVIDDEDEKHVTRLCDEADKLGIGVVHHCIVRK